MGNSDSKSEPTKLKQLFIFKFAKYYIAGLQDNLITWRVTVIAVLLHGATNLDPYLAYSHSYGIWG